MAARAVIGFLNGRSAREYARQLAAFHHGIGELGFVEGQNVAIEYRWAKGDNSRLSALAADLGGYAGPVSGGHICPH